MNHRVKRPLNCGACVSSVTMQITLPDEHAYESESEEKTWSVWSLQNQKRFSTQNFSTFFFCCFSARASWATRCLSCSSKSLLSCLMRDSTGDGSEDGPHDCDGLSTNVEGPAETHNGSCASFYFHSVNITTCTLNTSVCIGFALRLFRWIERRKRCLGWLWRLLDQCVVGILTLQEPIQETHIRLFNWWEMRMDLSKEEGLPFCCIWNRKMARVYSRLDLLFCETHFTKDEE